MTSKTIIAGAAVAGLMSGSFAVQAHAANASAKPGISQRQVGLQTEPQFGTRRIENVVGRDRGQGRVIKRDHLRPFEARHVQRQLFVRRDPVRFFPEKLFETLPEIAQVKDADGYFAR